MRHETLQRVTAFVRTIANKCPCVYNNTDRCHECLGRSAKILLLEIYADGHTPPQATKDNVYVRRSKILKILRDAGHPLLASEIVIGGACDKALKSFTITEMCRKGILGKKFAYQRGKTKYFKYYIKENNYENHNA